MSSLPLSSSPGAELFDDRLNRRKRSGSIFKYFCLLMTVFGVVALGALLYDIIGSTFTWAATTEREVRGESLPEVEETWPLWDGIFRRDEIKAEAAEKYPDSTFEFYSWINLDFFTQYPSRFPELSGFRSPILGSLLVIGLTALLSLPLGVAAAIYLEEYSAKGWLARFIEVNIANLAGVPSIIYGLLGLAIFVRSWESFTGGRTIIAGALVMTIVSLPVIIVAAREALRAVPPSIREAAYGVGATKWETTWSHVLPYALPGVLTGMILAMSRAIGETAPLITIGALTYIAFDPNGLRDTFTVMPIQIYNWVSLPQQAFHNVASAGITILLVILLSMNAIAIVIRKKTERTW